MYFRPDEIPARIETGDVHVGITGEDLYREYGDAHSVSHVLMPSLGFGGARLVVAVPQSWIDVSSVDDLDEAAMQFHQTHGRSLRVATKFARLTRTWFSDQGIVEYSLVESLGATEVAPTAGVADLIVDLTSTGATLAQNHLKEIDGGTVLSSHACLIASLREKIWDNATIAALEQIVEQIEARMRAAATVVLRFSVPSDNASAIRPTLTTRHGCTITSWRSSEGRRDDVVALVGKAKLYSAVNYLRASGSAEIIIDRSEFIFKGSSPAVDAFKQLLKHR
jgi:ATP phosphoribosyltransferase